MYPPSCFVENVGGKQLSAVTACNRLRACATPCWPDRLQDPKPAAQLSPSLLPPEALLTRSVTGTAQESNTMLCLISVSYNFLKNECDFMTKAAKWPFYLSSVLCRMKHFGIYIAKHRCRLGGVVEGPLHRVLL